MVCSMASAPCVEKKKEKNMSSPNSTDHGSFPHVPQYPDLVETDVSQEERKVR